MKDCPEITDLVNLVIGDRVVGFFEQRLDTQYMEVRVFTPIYIDTKARAFVN